MLSPDSNLVFADYICRQAVSTMDSTSAGYQDVYSIIGADDKDAEVEEPFNRALKVTLMKLPHLHACYTASLI